MKIPKPLANLMNQQINHELEAYYAYLAMAAWSESEDYPGIATWMKNQAQEELFHMMKIFNFLAEAGVTMEMKALAAPQNKFKSVEDMFKAGLKHEETQSQRFYKLQAEHYTTDTTPWGDIKGYEQFAKIFANMRLMGDPAQNDPILDRNLVGSPETVARRINELRALGFNYLLFSNAMHGVDREVRHRMMRRFAKEVIPLVNSLPVPETPVFEKVRAAE